MRLWLLLTLSANCALGAELWFQDLAPGSRLRLVNPHAYEQTLLLEVFSDQGLALNSRILKVAGGQALFLRGEDLGVVVDIRQLRLVSSATVLAHLLDDDGFRFVEREGQVLRAGTLPIPHIAEDLATWETYVTVNTSEGQAALRLLLPAALPAQDRLLPLQAHRQALRLDLDGYLGASAPRGSGWALLHSQGFPKLAGSLFFGTRDGRQGACLPLNLGRSCHLILPHIPADQINWWAGLALINTHAQALEVEVEIMGEAGPLGRTRLELAAQAKYVATLEQALGGIPAGASWLRFNAERSLVGFELFGTRNGEALAGLPLTRQATRRALLGWVGGPGEWSGAVLLNPSALAAEVELCAWSDQGLLVRSSHLTLPPYSRQTALLKELLGIQGNAYVELRASQGLLVFQLLGDQQLTKLAAFQAVGCEEDLLALGLPQPQFQTQANLGDRRLTLLRGDASMVPELVSEEGANLLFARQEEELKTRSIPFAEFAFSVPPNTPIYPHGLDLNQDGRDELLLNTTKMWIYSIEQGVPVVFQPTQPDVTQDPIIRHALDFNGDGWLDLLTNRAFFRSFPTLDNPYNLNSFPEQFSSSGKGSLFLELNGDPYLDLLTTFNDSFYAIITNRGLVETAIYTPLAYRDVLASDTFDFDGDGSAEVLSMLAQSTNSGQATHLDIGRVKLAASQSLAQFELPPLLGLSGFRLLNRGDSGIAQCQATFGAATRRFSVGLDGWAVEGHWGGQGEFHDVNGDRLPDLLSAAGVVRQEPGGWFPNPAIGLYLQTHTNQQSWLNLVDMDDDQEWEILEIRQAPGVTLAEVLLHRPAREWSSWETVLHFSIELATFGFARLQDWDGDGDLDLLIAGSGLTCYYQRDGQFDLRPTVLTTAASFAISTAMEVDFDQNGQPDLLGYKPGSGDRFHLVYNYLSSTPVARSIDVWGDLNQVRILDFDQDGLPDISFHDPRRNLSVLLNRGLADFLPKPIGWGITVFTPADFDGDGHMDVIGLVPVPDHKLQYLRLARNRGDASFSGFFLFPLPADTFYSRLISLDVNRDGRPDLVAIGPSESSRFEWVDIWLNDLEPGIPRIPLRRVSRLAFPSTSGLSAVDLDQDGWPDLQLEEKFNRFWFLSHVSLLRPAWANTHSYP